MHSILTYWIVSLTRTRHTAHEITSEAITNHKWYEQLESNAFASRCSLHTYFPDSTAEREWSANVYGSAKILTHDIFTTSGKMLYSMKILSTWNWCGIYGEHILPFYYSGSTKFVLMKCFHNLPLAHYALDMEINTDCPHICQAFIWLTHLPTPCGLFYTNKIVKHSAKFQIGFMLK